MARCDACGRNGWWTRILPTIRPGFLFVIGVALMSFPVRWLDRESLAGPLDVSWSKFAMLAVMLWIGARLLTPAAKSWLLEVAEARRVSRSDR